MSLMVLTSLRSFLRKTSNTGNYSWLLSFVTTSYLVELKGSTSPWPSHLVSVAPWPCLPLRLWSLTPVTMEDSCVEDWCLLLLQLSSNQGKIKDNI